MLALALLGVSTAGALFQSAPDLATLYTNPVPRDPAGQVLGVFVDGTATPTQYHVLSETGTLGAFELKGGEVLPASPRLELAKLSANQRWVLASEALGTWTSAAGTTGRLTTYTQLSPGSFSVERRGFWDVQSSSEGSVLFFLRGGHTFDEPGVLDVVEPTGQSRMAPLSFEQLPVASHSRDGRLLLVQAADRLRLFDGPLEVLSLSKQTGDSWLDPDGSWLALVSPSSVEVSKIDGSLTVSLPVAEPVMAVRFLGDHALVVERSVARLYDLAGVSPAVARVTVSAGTGSRFSSAALSPHSAGGLPWVALGELEVLVRSLVLPGAPAPRASARVRVLDPEGAAVLSWTAEVGDWLARTPQVEFWRRFLVVHTLDQALVSVESFP